MRQTLDEQIERYEKCLLFALEDIAHDTFAGTNISIGEAGYAYLDEKGQPQLTERGEAVLKSLQKKYLTFAWQLPIFH